VKDEQGKPLANGTFAKTQKYGRLIGELADKALAKSQPVSLTPVCHSQEGPLSAAGQSALQSRLAARHLRSPGVYLEDEQTAPEPFADKSKPIKERWRCARSWVIYGSATWTWP